MVHCKGGLGRAGTIASMLLIEKGCASPDILSLSVRVDGVRLSPPLLPGKTRSPNCATPKSLIKLGISTQATAVFG
ncbi:hypothetical protein [Stenotrophomonas hibiscicola]